MQAFIRFPMRAILKPILTGRIVYCAAAAGRVLPQLFGLAFVLGIIRTDGKCLLGLDARCRDCCFVCLFIFLLV